MYKGTQAPEGREFYFLLYQNNDFKDLATEKEKKRSKQNLVGVGSFHKAQLRQITAFGEIMETPVRPSTFIVGAACSFINHFSAGTRVLWSVDREHTFNTQDMIQTETI